MSANDEMHEVPYAEVITSTDLAWYIDFGDGDGMDDGTKAWLPMSQCELDSDNKVVWIPYWLLVDKELEDLAE